MIEYRQRVPEKRRHDPDYVARIRVNVAEELSRQASGEDDPNEYFLEALGNMSERDSLGPERGFWVHSYLDRERRAEYLAGDYTAPFKVPVPFAKTHDPVDFTPEELADHLSRKHGSRG